MGLESRINDILTSEVPSWRWWWEDGALHTGGPSSAKRIAEIITQHPDFGKARAVGSVVYVGAYRGPQKKSSKRRPLVSNEIGGDDPQGGSYAVEVRHTDGTRETESRWGHSSDARARVRELVHDLGMEARVVWEGPGSDKRLHGAGGKRRKAPVSPAAGRKRAGKGTARPARESATAARLRAKAERIRLLGRGV